MPRKAPHITVDFLREQFDYSAETGDLWWKVRRRGVTAFTPIRTHRKGYCRVMIRRRTYMVHQVIWALHHGEWSPLDQEMDHENLNGFDNRISNLRLATRGENSANRAKMTFKRGLTSRYKGVSWDKTRGLWAAAIWRDGRSLHLGRFVDEHEAHMVYCRAAASMQGEFARFG